MPKAWVPWFAKPNFVFFILNILNLFNYIDRGIIPGATNEFNEFIENNLHTSTPDVYLGLLQSAFIVGFIVGSILFGHLIHHHPRFYLTGIGVSIWIFAICTSGCAYFIDSYYVLLFGRMMSGFGEAALQCTIPPWIQTTAPESMRGTWLAIFFTAIPVGTALGYVYSSILAGSIGWEWAFFIEAIVVAPAVVFLFMISPHYPLDTEHHQRHESISLNTNTEYPDYAQRVRMSADMDVSPLQLAEEDKLMEEGEENDSSHGTRKSLLGKQNSSSSSPTSLSTQLNSDVGAASTASSHPNKRTASTGSQQIGSSRSSKSSAAATTTPPPPPSMWNEFKLIIVRPVFFCMTFAYAAQTGVLIGLSTFGSAFFMGLGFFNTESQASTVFGVLISLSGIIFTPMGGVVLDKLNVYSRRKFTESNEQGNMSDALYAAKCDSAVLDNVIILTFWGNAVGAVLMCMIFFIYSEALYMFTIALGAGAIFFCNASINMGLMMAVPLENRAFALAITYASIHAFGDVPSPILAGLLKDTLAPSCVGGNEDDDNVASSKACRDDNKGLRVTMLLISLWLIWTIVGYGMALVLNRTGQKERLLCCGTADTSTIDDDKPSSSIRGPLDAEEDAFAKEKAFAKVEVYDGNTTQSGGSVKNEEENSSGKGWQSFGSGAGAGGGRESGAAADAL